VEEDPNRGGVRFEQRDWRIEVSLSEEAAAKINELQVEMESCGMERMEVLVDAALRTGKIHQLKHVQQVRPLTEEVRARIARLLGEGEMAAASEPLEDAPPPTEPSEPLIAEWLMSLLCSSSEVREAVLGDLAERFQERAELDGLRSAQLWYWRQLAQSFGRFAWSWIVRAAELHSLLKLIGL
jgi:hypothetical protein